MISTSIFFVAPIALNAYRIRKYGEIEFLITTAKILTIVGLIITGLVISTNDAASFLLEKENSHHLVPCVNKTVGECLAAPCINFWLPYWQPVLRKSPFKSDILNGEYSSVSAFWDCCLTAIYSYTGTEITAIAAKKTKQDVSPKVIRRVSYQVTIYYMGAVLVLGLTVPSNDPLLRLSENDKPDYPGPFVLMMERGGIPLLAHIINVVMILAALSVATANLYITVHRQLS